MATTDASTRPFAPEHFTLAAGPGGGFGVVEHALARKLTALSTRSERLAVIVSLEDGRRANLFTQTLVDIECGAWVEAVSNEFITGEENLLGDDHHRLLAALGFAPPDDFSPNHHLVIDQPVDWAHVAGLLVRTLEAVYGATTHTPFTVEISDVGRYEDGGRCS